MQIAVRMNTRSFELSQSSSYCNLPALISPIHSTEIQAQVQTQNVCLPIRYLLSAQIMYPKPHSEKRIKETL